MVERVAGALLGSAALTAPTPVCHLHCDPDVTAAENRERVEVPEWAAFLANRRLCFTYLLTSAFPGKFLFGGSGQVGLVAAKVLDEELRQVVGESTTIHFDMPSWSVLQECQGETLVEAAKGTAYAGRPLMVEVEYGDGAVFYTSFHNRAQVSEQERVLLQLLVLKQISTSSNTTVAQAGQSLGISLTALKRHADS
jgi:hypothetical protein